jgi:fructosamine-3-kinase
MIRTTLNQTVSSNAPYSDAWRRVLTRLGDYTDIITRALNMRPRGAELFEQTTTCVLVRIRMPTEYVVLRMSPEDHLAREIYYGRTMAKHQLAAARILHHDMSRTLVPFTFTVENYIGGIPASKLESEPLLHMVARQVGRTLRRMHRIAAPGWGNPGRTGRWMVKDWKTVLQRLHRSFGAETIAPHIFEESVRVAIAAILEQLADLCPHPCLMHSAVSPQTVRCTVGEHVQLEALVDPGHIVGGDGLLDLACGMDPYYPAAWSNGLFEGYVNTAPLTPNEQQRLHLLRVLVCYWSACDRYFRGEPYDKHYSFVQSEKA